MDDEKSAVDITSFWTEEEVERIATQQIGKSSCGGTAVINTWIALHPGTNPSNQLLQHVKKCVHTKMRAYDANLPTYLKSRSLAGTTENDLLKGMELFCNAVSQTNRQQNEVDVTIQKSEHTLDTQHFVKPEDQAWANSDGVHPKTYASKTIRGKFYDFYEASKQGDLTPENIFAWLEKWMKKLAVPVVTLNPQRLYKKADAWHHQMIYGLKRKDGELLVLTTNPNEEITMEKLLQQCCSPPILQIRSIDILQKLTESFSAPNSPLSALDYPLFDEERWKQEDVKNQIKKLILELFNKEPFPRTHISIPASYRSGITLYIDEKSPHFDELLGEDVTAFMRRCEI